MPPKIGPEGRELDEKASLTAVRARDAEKRTFERGQVLLLASLLEKRNCQGERAAIRGRRQQSVDDVAN